MTRNNSTKNTNLKNNCNNSTETNNNIGQSGLGLSSFSYADYVILSSTLAYAIAEELNDADLDILLEFIGMLEANLAAIRTLRAVNNAQSQSANNQQNTGEEAVIGGEESAEVGEYVASIGDSRSKKLSKRKRVKKIKKVKNSK